MGRWDAGWRGVLSGLAPGGGRGYIAFGRLTGSGRHQRADWVPGLERRRVRHHRRRARLRTTPGMRRGPDQRVRGVGGHRSWPMATKQCLDAHDGRRTRISGRCAACAASLTTCNNYPFSLPAGSYLILSHIRVAVHVPRCGSTVIATAPPLVLFSPGTRSAVPTPCGFRCQSSPRRRRGLRSRRFRAGGLRPSQRGGGGGSLRPRRRS